MRIPSEILAPYLSEIDDKPSADNRRAEPVGQSADVHATPSSVDSGRLPLPRAERFEIADEAPRPDRKPERRTEERRRENRRKETRPVYLDTRSAKNRRKSARTTTIDFEM